MINCAEVCHECAKIDDLLKKTRRLAGNKPRTTSLATRRSTTELCPLLHSAMKIEAFYKFSKE